MSEKNSQIKVIEYEFNGNKYQEHIYINPKLSDGSLNPNYMSSKAIYKQETVLSSPIEGDFKKFVELEPNNPYSKLLKMEYLNE